MTNPPVSREYQAVASHWQQIRANALTKTTRHVCRGRCWSTWMATKVFTVKGPITGCRCRHGLERSFHLSDRSAVTAIVTIGVRVGDGIVSQAPVGRTNTVFYPPVVSRVRDHPDVKLQPAIKGRPVAPPVAIDKISGVGYCQPLAANQPLVDFHLALVTTLPGGIEVQPHRPCWWPCSPPR